MYLFGHIVTRKSHCKGKQKTRLKPDAAENLTNHWTLWWRGFDYRWVNSKTSFLGSVLDRSSIVRYRKLMNVPNSNLIMGSAMWPEDGPVFYAVIRCGRIIIATF